MGLRTLDAVPMILTKLHVVWVSPIGKRKTFEVAALHVHERAPANGTDLPWDLALLVLKSPVTDSTLPCVDLGRAQPILPPLATGDVGVVETWRGDFFSDRRVITALPVRVAAECRTRLVAPLQHVITQDRFCTGVGKDSRDSGIPGSPFFVRKADTWFLRGILSFSLERFFVEGPHIFTDLSGSPVRDWVQEKMLNDSSSAFNHEETDENVRLYFPLWK